MFVQRGSMKKIAAMYSPNFGRKFRIDGRKSPNKCATQLFGFLKFAGAAWPICELLFHHLLKGIEQVVILG